MAAKTKKAERIRHREEFDTRRLTAELRTPPQTGSAGGWSLADIYGAIDAQLMGRFERPVRLAERARIDDAMAVAFDNRCAPEKCIAIKMVPVKGARGASVAAEGAALFGQNGIGVTRDTRSDLEATLVQHGIAIGCNVQQPREDGSRIDYFMKAWPLEFVRWDPNLRRLMTRVEALPDVERAAHESANAYEIPIVPNDGRWSVFCAGEVENQPWKKGAIVTGAYIWPGHAHAIRDWCKGSTSHGSPKAIGQLPEGVALLKADGSLTDEAAAYIALLRAMLHEDSPAGIEPFGAKTRYEVNSSTAWQVWNELAQNREKAFARLYLGTDGTMGAQGGAPGVDITALFGVATTKIQGDLGILDRGIFTGIIQPWCATNFGDSTLAPFSTYDIPNPDADAAAESLNTRRSYFFADVKAARDGGFQMDQPDVDRIAADYNIAPMAIPLATAEKVPTIALAPTDIAKVVKVNEARASAGLGPLTRDDGTPDPDGNLTVAAFAAKQEATASDPNLQTPETAPQGSAPAPAASRSLGGPLRVL